jgi:hypothetical protein
MKKLFLHLVSMSFVVACTANHKLSALNPHVDPPVTPTQAFAKVTLDFKTLNPETLFTYLKEFFVIDYSGSNYNGSCQGTDPCPTDPANQRIERIINYINTVIANEGSSGRRQVAYVKFGDDATQLYPLTSDLVAFRNFLNNEDPNTGGWTNYLSALALVNSKIQEDVKAMADRGDYTSVFYAIHFITDGRPIVGGNAQDETTVLNAVKSLVDLTLVYRAIESVTINTGLYYYTDATHPPPAPTSAEVLITTHMATQGNGTYIDFGNNQNIDYSRFQPPSMNVPYVLMNRWVSNLSARWYVTGSGMDAKAKLSLDTDLDGLPDEREVLLGTNPNLADTDNDGLSDYQEVLAGLNPLVYQTPTICTRTATGSYRDINGDGLNDCISRLLGGNPDSVSSSLSILDTVAVLNGFTSLTNFSATGDPDSDGFNNLAETWRNTPAFFPDNRIQPLYPYEYVTSSYIPGEQEQYLINVSNIPILGEGNTIEVYLMEAAAARVSRRVIQTARKKLDPGQREITFHQEDFH